MADSVDGDPPGGEDGESGAPLPGRRGTGGQRRWHKRAGPAAREASALPTWAASPRPARPANPRRAQDRRLTATAAQAGSSQVGTGSNPLDGLWM
uniref:Uncharacterized protein n=1 Tax=Oryza sativa subsp. japonica TaxID=39947 RepID=Q5Z6X1_ORYSJ|nr:hypothetical protein [Oryza sativa Japonica Group]